MKLNSTRNTETDMLISAMLSLKNKEEFYSFFDDIFTISEIHAISQRFTVARMLDENTKYQEIAAKTGASTATISRVNRCLVYGAGGYRLVLDRIEK